MNLSNLSLEKIETDIENIYNSLKGVKSELLTAGNPASPYMEHVYTYLVKAFSLFTDYYGQYKYCLKMTDLKLKEDDLISTEDIEDDFPEEEE